MTYGCLFWKFLNSQSSLRKGIAPQLDRLGGNRLAINLVFINKTIFKWVNTNIFAINHLSIYEFQCKTYHILKEITKMPVDLQFFLTNPISTLFVVLSPEQDECCNAFVFDPRLQAPLPTWWEAPGQTIRDQVPLGWKKEEEGSIWKRTHNPGLVLRFWVIDITQFQSCGGFWRPAVLLESAHSRITSRPLKFPWTTPSPTTRLICDPVTDIVFIWFLKTFYVLKVIVVAAVETLDKGQKGLFWKAHLKHHKFVLLSSAFS